VESRLEAATPILKRAVVHHLPGHSYFVSLLALLTKPTSSNSSISNATPLPHHLLHDDVVAAISVRGSSAMTAMEAKSDKSVVGVLPPPHSHSVQDCQGDAY
jgi:hypothetical protein